MAKRRKAPKKAKITLWEPPIRPHNGEGRPDLQFPDPVSGDLIGGQVAFVRMSMRWPHCVFPWARRQGKTRGREFLYPQEATITPGEYYAGLTFPDHTTAAKIMDVFRRSWGDLVIDYKINDKDQDRWIELTPFTPPPGMEPPAWFLPHMVERWLRCQNGEPNTRVRIYGWGAAHPHYEKIQGFPHHFNRVGYDECQLIHPLAYGVIRPMTRDVMAPEEWTGTPWKDGIGNVQFEKFWDLAGDEAMNGWFRMRIPDGTNPYVPRTDLTEARKSMSEDEIRQTLWAHFLSGAGAVFKNIDNVFVLPALPRSHPHVAWIRALRAQFHMPSVEWWVHTPEPKKGHVYALSIDWARSPTGDYSACDIFDLTTGDQAALFRWRGEDLSQQTELVLALQKHYGARELHSDANGMGETMSDFMRRRHALGFIGHKFGRNKRDYVQRGCVLFDDADVRMIDCAEQKGEFKRFSSYEAQGLGSEKQIKFCAPEGEHDDTVAAFLQLAPTLTISGRRREPEPAPTPEPMLDENGMTTLEKWTRGRRLPPGWHGEEGKPSWDSVVIPR